jgi:hypothetical protein
MTTAVLNRDQFKFAIRAAFVNDNRIYSLYCPHVEVGSVDDIVDDIATRINNDVPKAVIKGVFEKSELIGYYVYYNKMLISFALNIKYRNRKYLKEFWSKIRSDLKGSFQCYLWSVNQRGWRWLCKMGMKIVAQDHLLTHLNY